MADTVPKTDEELRELLRELDDDPDIDVSSWEAQFIESVAFREGHRVGESLSERQREKTIEILTEYGYLEE